jgi:hypothetical protein
MQPGDSVVVNDEGLEQLELAVRCAIAGELKVPEVAC